MNARGSRGLRGSRWGVAAAVVVVAFVAAACAPPVTPPEKVDPRLVAMAEQLRASLEDPAFVASLGTTEQERADAVASIQGFVKDPGESGITTEELDRQQAEVRDAEAKAREAERAASEKKIATESAAAQAAATKNLVGAPSHDEVVAQGPLEQVDTDGETTDSWASKEGLGDAGRAIAARDAEVIAKIVAGTTAGDADAEELAEAGYGGSGTIEKTLPCQNRTGNRVSPKVGLDGSLPRPGAIYTPTQDAWTGLSTEARPVYSGTVQTRTVQTSSGDVEQVLVEGQLPVTTSMGALFPNIDKFRTHFYVQQLGQATREYWGATNSVNEPLGFEVQYLCYAEDGDLPAGSQITRGYYRAWVPITRPGGDQPTAVAEPGFQIRVVVGDRSDNYTNNFFFGADLRTVHVGPDPLAHHDPAPAALGTAINTGFLTDTNGQSNDDLESVAAPIIESAIEDNFHLLDGSGLWGLGGDSNAFGMFGFHINNAEPGVANVSLDIEPANGDDEHVIAVDLELRDFLLQGTAGLLVPCWFTTRMDAAVRITGAIDVHDVNRAYLLPDVTVSIQNLAAHDQFWQPLPPGCNMGYGVISEIISNSTAAIVNPLLANFVEDKLPALLSDKANVAELVEADVEFANGNGFVVALPGFNDTCAPYGCNGEHAGDIALIDEGLEATADFLITDRKPMYLKRRFPFSYKPTTSQPVSDLVRGHLEPGTDDPYSFAAFVSGDTINQLLRSVTEGGPAGAGGLGAPGVLDLSMADGAPLNTRPSVTPVFLNQSYSGKTVGLFLPEIRVDSGNTNRYAAALAVGVDVTFDEASGTVDPASIGPDSIAAGLAVTRLRCDNVSWFACNLMPDVINAVADQLGSQLLPELTAGTLGQLKIPQIAGFPLHSIQILNADGNLALYVALGTPYVIGSHSMFDDEFYFDANPGNFPDEGGPVTYDWVVRDIYNDNAIVFQGTTTQPHISLPESAFTPHYSPHAPGQWCIVKRRPDLQVTATEVTSDGTVTTATSQMPTWIDIQTELCP